MRYYTLNMFARYKLGSSAAGAIAIVLMVLATAAPTPAVAAKDDADRYDACMTRTHSAPQQALDEAIAWSREKGGDAAEHCAAVALIELQRYEDAGKRLENLASAMGKDESAIRAEVLAQAGLAWLLDGSLARAVEAQTAALEIRPDDPEILIDRSIALASAQSYWEAMDDLNRVIERAPDRVDALTYRGTVWRHLDSPELGRDDIARALSLDPAYPPALVERGNLSQLAGDRESARRDWRKVLDIAPGTKAADAARINLENIDRGAD